MWRKATATPCSVHDHLCSKLNPDFQFVLSLHSMELHHPFPRHPPASTPPTGKVPLRTDGTPDPLALGTGLDLPSSYLLSRRYLHRWVSVSELNQLLLSVCRSIYVLMSFCVTPQKDDYCWLSSWNFKWDTTKSTKVQHLIDFYYSTIVINLNSVLVFCLAVVILLATFGIFCNLSLGCVRLHLGHIWQWLFVCSAFPPAFF